MGPLQEIDVVTRSAAAADRVFALLADATSWTSWARLDEAAVESGSGVGEVRAFRSGEVTTRERVTALEPYHRLAYEVLSGLPVAGHAASVTLTALAGRGTKIRWRARFLPAVPGAGDLVRERLERFVRDAAEGLARAAEADLAREIHAPSD